jgi:putative transposase
MITPNINRAFGVVFDYIEMFYNPRRKHAGNGMLSPFAFERQQIVKAEGV